MRDFGITGLLGARKQEQLVYNLAAGEIELTSDEMEALDKVSQLPPEYPAWHNAVQSAGRWGPTEDSIWKDMLS